VHFFCFMSSCKQGLAFQVTALLFCCRALADHTLYDALHSGLRGHIHMCGAASPAVGNSCHGAEAAVLGVVDAMTQCMPAATANLC
jgi:hypothetical protein